MGFGGGPQALPLSGGVEVEVGGWRRVLGGRFFRNFFFGDFFKKESNKERRGFVRTLLGGVCAPSPRGPLFVVYIASDIKMARFNTKNGLKSP